jgi:hypothetical protein
MLRLICIHGGDSSTPAESLVSHSSALLTMILSKLEERFYSDAASETLSAEEKQATRNKFGRVELIYVERITEPGYHKI